MPSAYPVFVPLKITSPDPKKREPPDLGDSLFLLQEKIEDDDIHDAGNDRSQYGAETAES